MCRPHEPPCPRARPLPPALAILALVAPSCAALFPAAVAATPPSTSLAAPPPAASPPAPAAAAAAGSSDPAAAEGLALRVVALASVGEPGVEAVQRAAAARAERTSGGLPDFPARIRLAALLPRLTLEGRHDESSNRVVGQQASGEVDYLRLAPSNTVALRATWDLPNLVASGDELTAAAQAQARAKRRDEAVERATGLYFERRRLRVGLYLAPPADPVARAQAELEIARIGAELDALTGGAFRERVP